MRWNAHEDFQACPNFLQKMKTLKVLNSGNVKGEWVFNMRMVRLYIWLQSIEKEKSKT